MPCVLIIVLAAIFSGIFVYSVSLSKVNVMKENSKIVLDSFVTQKATEIFNSIKQGNDYTIRAVINLHSSTFAHWKETVKTCIV